MLHGFSGRAGATGLFVWFARPASRPPRALFVAGGRSVARAPSLCVFFRPAAYGPVPSRSLGPPRLRSRLFSRLVFVLVLGVVSCALGPAFRAGARFPAPFRLGGLACALAPALSPSWPSVRRPWPFSFAPPLVLPPAFARVLARRLVVAVLFGRRLGRSWVFPPAVAPFPPVARSARYPRSLALAPGFSASLATVCAPFAVGVWLSLPGLSLGGGLAVAPRSFARRGCGCRSPVFCSAGYSPMLNLCPPFLIFLQRLDYFRAVAAGFWSLLWEFFCLRKPAATHPPLAIPLCPVHTCARLANRRFAPPSPGSGIMWTFFCPSFGWVSVAGAHHRLRHRELGRDGVLFPSRSGSRSLRASFCRRLFPFCCKIRYVLY